MHPPPPPSRPCWHCRWWGGLTSGDHGLCLKPGLAPITAKPEHGCAFFEREPGADDDPAWRPTAGSPLRGVGERGGGKS